MYLYSHLTFGSNTYHPADVVEIDLGERTVAPYTIAKMHGWRGTIQRVQVGYDLYETAECLSKTNGELFVSGEFPNTEPGQEVMLDGTGPMIIAFCETIIPDTLFKIRARDFINDVEETLYYRKRKYVYEIQLPLVHYPLFGKPSYSFAHTRVVEEDYLKKVGNIFQQTPVIKPMSFSERLRYNLMNGFRKQSIFHGKI